jgi:hypothetical protein
MQGAVVCFAAGSPFMVIDARAIFGIDCHKPYARPCNDQLPRLKILRIGLPGIGST